MCPNPSNRKPPSGHVLALGQVDVQPVPHVVDAHPAVDQPPAPVHPDHLGLVVGVELVGQVADQGSEQVLDREDPLDPAVLVDHHGEGPSLAAHLGQHVEDEPGLGHQEGLAEPTGDVDGTR